MKNLLKNRTALSTVVTTLIILVVSVLLAGVVTYFAINVTSTRVQEESLNLMYQHIWYSTDSGGAEAAVMITNTGGRDVVIDKIAVRGQTVQWSNVFVYNAGTGETVTELYYFDQSNSSNTAVTFTKHTGSPLTGNLGGSTPAPVAKPAILKSGNTIILYMTTLGLTSTPTVTNISPGSVTVNDVGLTIALSVFTAQATYYKETNVNAVPTSY
jgi:hypothetical protein